MAALELLAAQEAKSIVIGAVIGITFLGAIVRQRFQLRSRRRLQAAIQAYQDIELSRLSA